MIEFILKYWLQVVFGLLITGLGVAYKKIHCLVSDQKSLREGTQALLRNEIIRSYDKYKERGWIPIYALDNVLAMYEAYHALKGNGTVTGLVKELKGLPHQPLEERAEA